MASLSFSHVTKRYGQTLALDDVSFECREGEFLTIFGPSGAGKTTTLELIAGIQKDYEGTIRIDGEPVEGVPIQARNVAMAFENYALYPHFTVAENIAFPLRSPRAPKRSEAEILAKVQSVADQLGIGQLLERNPIQLSGGQKQRVSLARALVREPRAYLLDEPIAHLDAKLRTIARANLKDMANRLGTTILYVTHDYREALGLSDRVLILREGRVEQIGTPREIYYSPVSDFVAWLVGDPLINLVDGEVVEADGRLVFHGPGLELELPRSLVPALEAAVGTGHERKVRLGIRPGDVAVGLHAPAEPGAHPFEIFSFERLPGQNLVFAELGPAVFAAATRANAGFEVGAPAWFRPNLEKAYVFKRTFDISR